MYSLVNVPTAASGVEIKGVVEGDHILIIAAEKGSKWRDGHSVMMADTWLGEHVLSAPEFLRQKYADDLATAIRMGRDAGYAQALADIRHLLGIKNQ
jgi:hypothetical protein